MSQQSFDDMDRDSMFSHDRDNFGDNSLTLADHRKIDETFKSLETINYDLLCTRIQCRIFMCGGCGEEVREQELKEHHTKVHAETPFIMEMYELYEIDEEIKCSICNADLDEGTVEEHIMLTHSNLADFTNDYASTNEPSMDGWQPMDSYSSDPSLYDDNDRISGNDLDYADYSTAIWDNGYQTTHGNMNPTLNPAMVNGSSMNSNIFDLIDEDRTNGAPEGFRNICVSNSEFYRLVSKNRIYLHEERYHLQDSKIWVIDFKAI